MIKTRKPTRSAKTTQASTMTPLRIRQLRNARGLTLEDMAAAIGSDPINISRLERGLQGYTDKTLRAIAKALGVSIVELFSEGELHAGNAYNTEAPREVLVMGEIVGGADGEIQAGGKVARTRANVAFPAKHKSAYALVVRGDGFRPRIKPGEIIVLEPDITPKPGDDVLLILKSGARYLKQLLYQRDQEITLGSINAASQVLTISLAEIGALHFIAGIIQQSI